MASEIDRSGHVFGNFSNYYAFHPAESRIGQFVPGCFSTNWEAASRPESLYFMDVGCNDGTLSLSLLQHVEKELTAYITRKYPEKKFDITLYMLGIDVDDELIKRANLHSISDKLEEQVNTGIVLIKKHFTYIAHDIMKDSSSGSVIRQYLTQYSALGFNFISLFSVTMWVHLNYGDDGLNSLYCTIVQLLHRATQPSQNATDSTDDKVIQGSILVEPQPWKCYRTARKRCKTNSLPFPPHMGSIIIKDSVQHATDCFHSVNQVNISDKPVVSAIVNTSTSVVDRTVSAVSIPLSNESHWGRSMLWFDIHTTEEFVQAYFSNKEDHKLYANVPVTHESEVDIKTDTSNSNSHKRQKT